MGEKVLTKEELQASIHKKIKNTLEAPVGLYDKLGIKDTGNKIGISEGRVEAVKPELIQAFSFYREYPDIYLEQLADPEENFKFYFYQRVFLRIAIRHRYVYATFPRAYSKSFLSILTLYCRCIFYPNAKLFIVSGGKEQSAKIAAEKLDEIWKFFPSMKNELIWGMGNHTTKLQKDYINLRFKNGSYLDIVAARESARGGRRTGGLIEEAAQVPGHILSEVVIPRRKIMGLLAVMLVEKIVNSIA